MKKIHLNCLQNQCNGSLVRFITLNRHHSFHARLLRRRQLRFRGPDAGYVQIRQYRALPRQPLRLRKYFPRGGRRYIIY